MTAPTASSPATSRQARTRSSVTASSIAFPRALSMRRTAVRPSRSTRIAPTRTSPASEPRSGYYLEPGASDPEPELGGGRRPARAFLAPEGIREAVLLPQTAHQGVEPLAIAAAEVDAPIVGLLVRLQIPRELPGDPAQVLLAGGRAQEEDVAGSGSDAGRGGRGEKRVEPRFAVGQGGQDGGHGDGHPDLRLREPPHDGETHLGGRGPGLDPAQQIGIEGDQAHVHGELR